MTQAGDINEETTTPTPLAPHSYYNYNNKTYTYPTRLVTRIGVQTTNVARYSHLNAELWIDKNGVKFEIRESRKSPTSRESEFNCLAKLLHDVS